MKRESPRYLIQLVWDTIDKPPWIKLIPTSTSAWAGQTLYYQIHNEKRNKRQAVTFEPHEMFSLDDRETGRYITNKIYATLHDVTRNTLDSAVGSMDVYREDG